MRYLLLAVVAFLAAIGVGSCISDDFDTSPSVRLRFSTDTVAFDTVFTDLGTPTARLKVFNPQKKAVNISSIGFRDASSVFSMNVDGVSGTTFHDVEIRGGDSIFIFIECYIPESQTPDPFLREDLLVFNTNGTEQSVVVEAYGQNVTRLRNVEVTADMTMTAERPYVVFDSLTVRPGATLRIEPGARLLFHDKASLVVEGCLEAVGEPGRLIDLRGDRLDNVLPDVGYDIMAGQWQGVRIAAGSFGNRMEYVNMRSTRKGLRIDSTGGDLGRQKLTLVNSWLHNSQGTVLDSRYAKVDAYGCIFSEAAEAVVRLTGGVHDFAQCTLSNYYLFSIPSEPILSLYHVLPEDMVNVDNPNPLMRATFGNSIIYGMTSDINTGDLTGSEVFLRYVLMKSAGSDDANFQHCLWDTDPMFETVREDYIFNYRLKADSPAIGAGDPSLVPALSRSDIDGIMRRTPPALGAYAAPE
ncbi:MAG: hypothetical protein K2F87_05615 [Muribaculaceae bacterium]|nr:hypothetical protein [Muribaculaceae bacterium]